MNIYHLTYSAAFLQHDLTNDLIQSLAKGI